jgi:23S rRNA pseudouridine1911/1915/1917 synthase
MFYKIILTKYLLSSFHVSPLFFKNRFPRISNNDFIKNTNKLIFFNIKVDKIRGIKKITTVKRRLPFSLVYQDNNLVIINKKCVIPIYLNTYKNCLTICDYINIITLNKKISGNKYYSGLIHRIDKLSTGIVMQAKNITIFKQFKLKFEKKSIFKYYQILCFGKTKEHFSLTTYHNREVNQRTKYSSKINKSLNLNRIAYSKYQTLNTSNEISRLHVNIITGRTHQIRVQMSEIDKPVIGDFLYSKKSLSMKIYKTNMQIFKVVSANRTIFLHSERVAFLHPLKNKKILFYCKSPDTFNKFHL